VNFGFLYLHNITKRPCVFTPTFWLWLSLVHKFWL
jgi:hypothetical protein